MSDFICPRCSKWLCFHAHSDDGPSLPFQNSKSPLHEGHKVHKWPSPMWHPGISYRPLLTSVQASSATEASEMAPSASLERGEVYEKYKDGAQNSSVILHKSVFKSCENNLFYQHWSSQHFGSWRWSRRETLRKRDIIKDMDCFLKYLGSLRYLLANAYRHAFIFVCGCWVQKPLQAVSSLMEGQGQINLSCTNMGGQYSGASFILPWQEQRTKQIAILTWVHPSTLGCSLDF